MPPSSPFPKETPYLRDASLPVHGGRHLFRRGSWTFRHRGTPDWLLMLTVSGKCKVITTSKTRHTLTSGEILLYAPGTRQHLGVEGAQWEVSWAHFAPRSSWMNFLHWPEIEPGLRSISLRQHPQSFSKMLQVMQRFHESLARRDESPHGIALAMNALEEVILLIDSHGVAHAENCKDDRILLASRILAREWKKPPSTINLAKRCGLSISRFCDLFQKSTKTTVGNYLEERKFQQAKLLLSTTRSPIHSISDELGYDDPFYFTRRFVKKYGLSPREFRKKSITSLL